MRHFTNLAPNTEYDDALKALGILLTPWRWGRGSAAQKLETELAKRMPGLRFFTFESGRTALTTLLQAYNIGAGDEVIVQAYTCVAVPDPILWVGATPIYVDCDESLTARVEDIERNITPRTKAIIVQHTFGMPANIEAIQALAARYSLLFIEDCAHALGATYQGKPLGTFGDASFFSFGRDKVISSVFGGALAVRNPAIQERIAQVQNAMKKPSLLWIAQQLMHPPLMWLGKKIYSFGGVGIIWLARTGITSKAVYREEKQGGKPSFIGHQLPNALALLALHQLAKLNRFRAHRTAIADIYRTELATLPVTHQTVTPNADPAYLRYTLWCDKAEPIRAYCTARGILLGDWYTTPIAPLGVDYQKISYRVGSCPHAERIASQTLNLPTDIHCTPEKARTICNQLKTCYAVSE